MLAATQTLCLAETVGSLTMFSLHIEASEAATRLVATFNRQPRQRLMLLANPPRLVVDLPQTDFIVPADAVVARGLVKSIRYGLDGAGGARLVLGLDTPFEIGSLEIEPLHDEIWQLSIELHEIDAQHFVADLATKSSLEARDENAALPSIPTQENLEKNKGQINTPPQRPKPFTVMIDAGHGGVDSGAQGIGGVLEKDVTLAFAHALRETLQRKAFERGESVTIYLTREKDEFLGLRQRVVQARDKKADLFISIHADSIHIPSLRGATVYTLSDQASDTLAKSIAENENRTEILSGVPPDEPSEVMDILLDLTRRETDAFSRRFAETLIISLHQGNIKLMKDPHRYAGFMVLKAPDVPSILLELGYLSNQQDEQLITDPVWRQHMTELIADAVLEFARIYR